MSSERLTVFLPCHTLDDFPTWLDEAEAADVLASWTACWHPWLISAVGGPPGWASIDLPLAEGRHVAIVPAAFDGRFAGQSGGGPDESVYVRCVSGLEACQAAVVEAVRGSGNGTGQGGDLPGEGFADDFRALGLAVLLAELLARRMRSAADLESAGFAPLAVAAACAAVEGRDEEARGLLRDCFGCLEATRARYYPVDSWIIDLVLLAGSTSTAAVAAAVDSPVPVAVAASGQTLDHLAAERPAAIAVLRDALATGRLGLCGGLADDRGIDACTPEELVASFDRGRAAWRDHLGREPATFARRGGGGSALVPLLLAGYGYRAAIWGLFDGSPLPDPGGGRIRWEGSGGVVEAIAKQPLDARDARTILSLPESLGDAMDHDHAAILLFAHYAGTASPWHTLLRRIGGWSSLLGGFVTPDELVERTAGAGLTASFEPDAFPPTLPAALSGGGEDPVGAAVAAARREAERIVAAAAPLEAMLARPTAGAATARAAGEPAHQRRKSWVFGGPHRTAAELVLDNGLVRVEAHSRTGGLLSLRRPGDRGNRLSQQLAIRTTRPAPATGAAWQSAEDRSVYTLMEADAVARIAGPEGAAVESRGRLVDAQGAVSGRFVQRIHLAPGLPLAILDIDVEATQPLAGAVLENHVASRFAWHENEDVEIRRSLHTQAIVTERSRLVAPHFVELVPAASRLSAGDEPVVILTGGLPWHLLATPHVLDAVLGTGPRVVRRLAVGIGIERPWDPALALLAGGPLGAGPGGVPANVRLTMHDVALEAGRPVRARVGLLEAAGLAGEVRLEWAVDLVRVTPVDFRGEPRDDVTVRLDGRAVVASLGRYEWLLLDMEFAR